MSQSGYTPIQLYRTTTAAAAPTAGNLVAGELAINTTDEKLYFKNTAGTVKLLASSAGAAGSVTSVDVSGGTTGLSFSGGPITTSGTIMMAGTLGVANGGTGATTLTSGYLTKGNGTSAVTASIVYDTGTAVGILTSSPQRPLHVLYDSAVVGQYSMLLQGKTGGYGAGVSFQSNLTGGSLAEMARITADGEAAWDTTAANQDAGLRFYTSLDGAVAEKMRINAAGYVGIGTTSPGASLDVRGANGLGIRYIENTTGNTNRIQLGTGSGFGYIDATAGVGSTALSLQVASTERMRIDSSGNVGIGTSAMFDKLNVLGAGANISVDTLTATDNNGFIIRSNNTERGSLRMQGNLGLMTLTAGYAGYGGILAINTNGSERMRVDTSGNVGIGTNNPASFGRLAVLGSATASFMVTTVSNGTAASPVETQIAGAVYSSTGAVPAGMYSLNEFATNNAHYLSFKTTSAANVTAERMRIDGSGNVTLSAKIVPNVQSVSSAATITPNANSDTQVSVTALAVAATIAAPSGTPSDGQSLVIRIKDNGTGRALTWTTGSSGSYRAVGATLPTTTVANKTVYIGCKYNSTDLRWDVIAVSQEA